MMSRLHDTGGVSDVMHTMPAIIWTLSGSSRSPCCFSVPVEV